MKNNEKINYKIAKFLYGNLIEGKTSFGDKIYYYYMDDAGWQPIPYFTDDLNAVAKVEEKLDADQYCSYIDRLLFITRGKSVCVGFRCAEDYRATISATALQRAKALYQVLKRK